MPSAVADVLDMERVLSLAPLAFDLTSAFVAGWQAVCRRILYRWCTRIGSNLSDPNYGVTIPITSLRGVTLAPQDLRGIRADLARQALQEDFVTGAVVNATLSPAGLLSISARITLTDGLTYALEVGPEGAINQLGGTQRTPSEIQALIASYPLT
jgi:hypothetical protein